VLVDPDDHDDATASSASFSSASSSESNSFLLFGDRASSASLASSASSGSQSSFMSLRSTSSSRHFLHSGSERIKQAVRKIRRRRTLTNGDGDVHGISERAKELGKIKSAAKRRAYFISQKRRKEIIFGPEVG
jgi:hypothetical protein